MSMFKANQKKTEVHGKSHVRKNDTVTVLSGKDRGKQGKVLRVIPSKGTAIVERVNFTKKHVKANPGKNQKGGVMERESPVQISNLKVICPSCGEPTRIGARVSDEGNSRVCKKCDSELGS